MKLYRTRAGSRATLGTGHGLVFRTAEPRPAVFGTSRLKRILNGGRVFQGSLLLQRQTSQKQRKTTLSLCADIVAYNWPFLLCVIPGISGKSERRRPAFEIDPMAQWSSSPAAGPRVSIFRLCGRQIIKTVAYLG